MESSRTDDEALHRIQAVLFLGCPHRGSTFTRAGTYFAKFLGPLGSNTELLHGLEYDSMDLLDLHDAFLSTAYNQKINCTNFYEQRPIKLFGVEIAMVGYPLSVTNA